jgi:hypothetical protein
MSFLGDIFGNLFGNNQFGSQTTPQVSPDTVANVAAQQSAAANYGLSGMTGDINAQMTGLNAQAQNQSLQDDRSINAANSKRGLLYSGLNEAQKVQNKSNLAQGLAQRRAALNQQGVQNAVNYSTQAANAGLNMANIQEAAANQQYQGNVAGSKQNPGFLGGFLNGF